MMGVDAIKNERLKAKQRGVNFRYITEVTNDNISYCKELSKFAEVRHLDGIKGNFEVSKGNRLRDAKGGEYIATASLQEAEPVAQLIYSNVREIVEQEQFVFDTLWNKAIPFQVRLKEIEEGIKRESIEIIIDPKQALEEELRLLNSAKEEIQMIFSTVNTFLLQERQIGITQILSKLSTQGVKVRILTPIDNDVKELISNLKNQPKRNNESNSISTNNVNNSNNNHNSNTISNTNGNSIIDIQNIEPSSSINAKIIIVDKQDSLAMEIKDEMKDSLDDTIGLSTLSNSKSTIISYSAIFENLSKQNHLYKQLKETYQEVENTNLMQREFINIAAHELRTPIQPILGYAELLLEEETDDTKKHALLGILHNSERLQKLASDILDIARIESDTFLVNKKVINLNSFISNAIKDYAKRLKQRESRDIAGLISNVNGGGGGNHDKNKDHKRMQARLLLRSSLEEDVFVQGDEERLMQVMHNILDNAFKFTDSHGSVTVTLEKEETQHQTQIEEPTQQPLQQKGQEQEQQEQLQRAIINITDRGTGIDPEILPKLFSKFATKSYKGTGLGLYISKNIVDAHGGKLLASNNTDGNGATFTIVIPLFNKDQDHIE
jgi:two-component system, OmpR family, sensor histidine kinase VicK